jgi:hypothetical protein
VRSGDITGDEATIFQQIRDKRARARDPQLREARNAYSRVRGQTDEELRVTRNEAPTQYERMIADQRVRGEEPMKPDDWYDVRQRDAAQRESGLEARRTAMASEEAPRPPETPDEAPARGKQPEKVDFDAEQEDFDYMNDLVVRPREELESGSALDRHNLERIDRGEEPIPPSVWKLEQSRQTARGVAGAVAVGGAALAAGEDKDNLAAAGVLAAGVPLRGRMADILRRLYKAGDARIAPPEIVDDVARRSGYTRLVRYIPERTTTLDPSDPASRTGSAGREMRRQPGLERVYYYAEDVKPWDDVSVETRTGKQQADEINENIENPASGGRWGHAGGGRIVRQQGDRGALHLR